MKESPDFFQASSFQLRKLEIHCDNHLSPSVEIMVLMRKEI